MTDTFKPNRIALSAWGNSAAVERGRARLPKAQKLICERCLRAMTHQKFKHHRTHECVGANKI